MFSNVRIQLIVFMNQNDDNQGSYYGQTRSGGDNNSYGGGNDRGGYGGDRGGYGGDRGGYSSRPQPEDIHSVKIELERKTFYVDLKKGKDYFVKISEKSNKGRSTIVIDVPDYAKLTAALAEIQAKIDEIAPQSAHHEQQPAEHDQPTEEEPVAA